MDCEWSDAYTVIVTHTYRRVMDLRGGWVANCSSCKWRNCVLGSFQQSARNVVRFRSVWLDVENQVLKEWVLSRQVRRFSIEEHSFGPSDNRTSRRNHAELTAREDTAIETPPIEGSGIENECSGSWYPLLVLSWLPHLMCLRHADWSEVRTDSSYLASEPDGARESSHAVDSAERTRIYYERCWWYWHVNIVHTMQRISCNIIIVCCYSCGDWVQLVAQAIVGLNGET